MNESYLKMNKIRAVINLLTAVFFSLFIAYHTYLAVEIEAPDDLMDQPTDDDILFSTSESSAKKSRKKNTSTKKRLPTDFDDDFVI